MTAEEEGKNAASSILMGTRGEHKWSGGWWGLVGGENPTIKSDHMLVGM